MENRSNKTEVERRYIVSPVKRNEDEGVIEGIAAVVNTRTDLRYFYEEVAPGAFDDVLNDDVRALFNHDMNYPLARTKSGTLALSLSEEGHLVYKYKTPNRSYAKDLEDSIRTGDVDQSSFAFTIEDEEWRDMESEKPTRVIKRIGKLVDVSPVTYPAYESTTVAARSLYETVKNEWEVQQEKRNKEEQKEDLQDETRRGKSLDLYKRKLNLIKLKK